MNIKGSASFFFIKYSFRIHSKNKKQLFGESKKKKMISYFVIYLMAPIIFIFGLVGNLLGLLVLLRKNLAKIGPRIMYRFLLMMDIINLLSIIVNYLNSVCNFNLQIMSTYSCKFYWYLILLVGPIPPYILLYISVEKIIATKYPTRKYFLRKTETQIIYFSILICFNIAYNLITFFILEIIQIPPSQNNSTSLIDICYTNDYELYKIGNWMDIVNRVILPTVLMILTSIIFLNSIWNLNQRIAQNFGTNQNLKKQISRIVSLIILNISYIIFSLPVSIVGFYFMFNDIEFLASYYLKMIAYSISFYIILFTNSLFRKEFLSIF